MELKDCETVRRQLSAMLDGELDTADEAAVAKHLDACPLCLKEWRQLRALDHALKELAAPVPLGMPEAVLARIRPRRRYLWQTVALAASLVVGISLGGAMAHKFYPGAMVSETASLEAFNDFPQGSLGTILASYQPEEGNGL